MKLFNWNPEKNEQLIAQRGISFEVVVSYIEKELVLDIIEHPNKSKYENQKIFIIRIEDYVYLIPFIESKDEVFLKTIIPSRKATKKYLEN